MKTVLCILERYPSRVQCRSGTSLFVNVSKERWHPQSWRVECVRSCKVTAVAVGGGDESPA